VAANIVDHARKRIAAVCDEIARLKQSDFPYAHPIEALDILEKKFRDQDAVLAKVSPTASPNVKNNACGMSLYQLYMYVPLLGFILRSTNVRNAFEVYAPLLRLAQSIFGENKKLVVSSEWEYSPFVYLPGFDLPGFVLIGLPAPETTNPFLVSLAGHELGHSFWEAEGCATRFAKIIEERVIQELTERRWSDYALLYPHHTKDQIRSGDMFVRPTWFPAFTWALLQAEEVFCDFFGLRLFAESYLYAFEYLSAPGSSGQRPLHYPKLEHRLSYIVAAAKEMGIEVQPGFDSCFMDETDPDEAATKLLVSISDEVSKSLVPELIQIAKEVQSSKAPLRNRDNVKDICEEFGTWIVPSRKESSLSDILNAGWLCYLDPDLWKNIPHIRPEDRDRVLKDLMLKSMEISEVHKRLREAK